MERAQLCDGKDDCGDNDDEKQCRNRPNVKLRLVGGRSKNEGRIEIKALDYGTENVLSKIPKYILRNSGNPALKIFYKLDFRQKHASEN